MRGAALAGTEKNRPLSVVPVVGFIGTVVGIPSVSRALRRRGPEYQWPPPRKQPSRGDNLAFACSGTEPSSKGMNVDASVPHGQRVMAQVGDAVIS